MQAVGCVDNSQGWDKAAQLDDVAQGLDKAETTQSPSGPFLSGLSPTISRSNFLTPWTNNMRQEPLTKWDRLHNSVNHNSCFIYLHALHAPGTKCALLPCRKMLAICLFGCHSSDCSADILNAQSLPQGDTILPLLYLANHLLLTLLRC